MAAIPIDEKKKTLKTLLLQNQESFECESHNKAFGIQGLPNLFKL